MTTTTTTTTKRTLATRDYLCLAALTAILAIISITAPALYVLLWIVAGFLAIAAFSFVVTKELLSSDCPIDNAVGVSVMLSLFNLLNSIND